MSNTCAAPAATCVPDATQYGYQTVNRDLGCTGGWVGQRIWAFDQVRSQTSYCATPTSSPQWNAWSAWADTGTSSLVSNTCAAPPPSCGPAPAPVGGTLACPAGYSGSITTSQGWNSVAAPTCWAPGAVTQTSNTCASTCPAGASYYGSSPVITPVLIGFGVNGNNGAGFPGVWSVGRVLTTQPGPSSGFFTVQVTYMGQTVQATATCVGGIAKFGTNDYCQTDSGAFTFNVGGGTFEVGVYSYKPSQGDTGAAPWGANGAAPWGANGAATMLSKAPGC